MNKEFRQWQVEESLRYNRWPEQCQCGHRQRFHM